MSISAVTTLPPNKENFSYETPCFFVTNIFDMKPYSVTVQDWREGWKKTGKLIGDGLPVLRMISHKPAAEYLMRPYYLVDSHGEYLRNFIGTTNKVIEFIKPTLGLKEISKEGNRYTLVPLFDRPIHDDATGTDSVRKISTEAARKTSNPPKPEKKEEKKS